MGLVDVGAVGCPGHGCIPVHGATLHGHVCTYPLVLDMAVCGKEEGKNVSSEHLSTVALEIRSHLLIWEVKRRTGVWAGTVLVPRKAQVLLLPPAMIYFGLE